MIASRRSVRAVVLAGWVLLAALQGCSMLGQNSKNTKNQKNVPQTVGEWMKQPRVEP